MTIREALTFAGLNSKRRPFPVRHGAGVIAKIELSKVTVQVLFSAILIIAAHSALKEAEVTFYGIGRHIATGVFLGA